MFECIMVIDLITFARHIHWQFILVQNLKLAMKKVQFVRIFSECIPRENWYIAQTLFRFDSFARKYLQFLLPNFLRYTSG